MAPSFGDNEKVEHIEQVCKCDKGFFGAFCDKSSADFTPSCRKDANGAVCSGKGKCEQAGNGPAKCKCDAGAFGRDCEIAGKAQLTQKKNQAKNKANGAKDIGAQKKKLAQCPNDKKYRCPNETWAGANADQCVKGPKDCDSSGTNMKNARAACNQKAKNGEAIDTTCAVLLTPVRKCDKGEKRCPDGSCAAAAATCAASDQCVNETTNKYACLDGVSCAADKKGCAKLMKWDGCAVGEIECASAGKLVCVTDATLCPCTVDGEEYCGPLRDDSGKVVRDVDGKTTAVCKTVGECATSGYRSRAFDAINTTVAAGTTAPAALKDANGTEVLEIAIPSATDPETGAAVAVELVAETPADSDVEISSLGSTVGDTDVSAYTSIDANTVFDVTEANPICMDIPVDFDASTGATCADALLNFVPKTQEDITNDTETSEFAGTCEMGAIAPCSCKFCTTHLSTYVVSDITEAETEAVSTEVATEAATTQNSNDIAAAVSNVLGSGSMAQPVAATIATVVALAAMLF
eukprot:GFYU01001412.1.p2 GENE.GFYU01001412.1~~GFYU01001412.1.p2  ORF type:complete len:577 (-),score=244.63 GFYU01001412.1:54-1616(-)